MSRAKLFRFTNGEWKERGLGDMKILKNKNGKARVLMRRENIHKLCANHYIKSWMTMSKMSGKENTRIWIAFDDTMDEDTEPTKQQFCVRFKEAETAADFEKTFMANRDEESTSEPVKKEEPAEKPVEKPKAPIFGAVPPPKVEEKEEEKKPNLFGGIASALKKTDSGNTSGGFSFNFGGSQPAPSAGADSSKPFAFGSSGGGGGFGALAKTADSKPAFSGGFQFANKGKSLFGNTTENKDDNEEPEQNENDPYFEPIVKLDEVEVKTGEEGLEVIFNQRAKLFRWNDNQWKQRGVGECKILKDPENGKARLLLRRDQVLKLACNHFIQPEMNLIPMKGDAKSLTWVAMDNADGEPQLEKFAIKFKNEDLAAQFTTAFDSMKNPGEKPKITGFSFGVKAESKPAENKGVFGFGIKSDPPKNETPGEMVQRLEREKMNADIAKAASSGKFTFGAASATTSSSTSNNTGFGSSNNTGFGGFGGVGTAGAKTSFSFGVATTSQPSSGKI